MPGHIDLNSQTDTLRTLDERLARGEEVLLTRDGRPVARVVPVPVATAVDDQAERERLAALRRSAFGMFAGQIDVAAFEAPLPDDIFEAMIDPVIFPNRD